MLIDAQMKMLEYTLGAADAGVSAVSCAALPTGADGRVIDLAAISEGGVVGSPNVDGLMWDCKLGTDAAVSAATDDSVAITLETSVDEAFSSAILVCSLGAILTANLTAARQLYLGLIGTTIYTVVGATNTGSGGTVGSMVTYLRRYVRTKVVVVSTNADYTAGIIYSELKLWRPNSMNRRIFSVNG
jgi:hypothetical protein